MLQHRRRQVPGLRSFLDPEIQGARDAGQTHLDPPRAGRSAGRGERPGIPEIAAVDLNIRAIADGEQGLATGDLARLVHIRRTTRVRPRIGQRLRGPREIRGLQLKAVWGVAYLELVGRPDRVGSAGLVGRPGRVAAAANGERQYEDHPRECRTLPYGNHVHLSQAQAQQEGLSNIAPKRCD